MGISKPTPRQLLLAGWLGFLVYAYPGYMSFDSVYQLRESRWGHFSDGHPPAFAALWRIVELVIAGPLGMLLIQSACFLAGVYLLLRRRMSERRAAIAASLVLWFPPIAGVIAVIWKDSMMTAFAVLGLALILEDRKRARVLGLVALCACTLMRHNALVITGPLIVLGFVWNPEHRFVKRYALAIGAWVAITITAQLVTGALTSERRYIWHNSLALNDMASTLRFVDEEIPDAELQTIFAGVVVKPDDHLHAFVRDADLHGRYYVDEMWKTTYKFFAIPRTQDERDAVVRAWKRIVFEHKGAYLAYRWEVFRRLLGLGGEEPASPVYAWFTDIQEPYLSAAYIDHDATAGHVQDRLRDAIHVVGATPIFSVMLYVVLALVLVPFAWRDRAALGLLGSAITSEAVLFLLAPTSDWRYSFWLIVAVVIAVVLIVARRAKSRDTGAA
jgi:hypothetical protein